VLLDLLHKFWTLLYRKYERFQERDMPPAHNGQHVDQQKRCVRHGGRRSREGPRTEPSKYKARTLCPSKFQDRYQNLIGYCWSHSSKNFIKICPLRFEFYPADRQRDKRSENISTANIIDFGSRYQRRCRASSHAYR